MRQKGEHCLDLATTALCMDSGLCKGCLLGVSLHRRRCHCGSRQKSCRRVTAHIAGLHQGLITH